MKIVSTYKVKTHGESCLFAATEGKYREVVDYLIAVALVEWETLFAIEKPLEQQRALESIVHATAKNPEPKHPEFDGKFPSFPSYLRRAAIAEAIGQVSSYKSNLARWEKSGKKNGKPRPPKAGFAHPTLYAGENYRDEQTEAHRIYTAEKLNEKRRTEGKPSVPVAPNEFQGDPYSARIKVWIDNRWDWVSVRLNKGDVDYISRKTNCKRLAPMLLRKGKNWFLAFPLEERAKLSDTPLKKQTILSVDLGINNGCVCSAMRWDGTITARKFYRDGEDEGCLMHALNTIRKAQSHGARKMPKLYAWARSTNKRVASATADFIVKSAVECGADVIVFEHLDHKGKKHLGKMAMRVHLWCCNAVQKMVELRAHRLGIRVARVCAWNTSKFAFDGSGEVERGINGNYSICRFASGKTYNCDLSASYNIGARYFIRELLAPLKEEALKKLRRLIPNLRSRPLCTWSTLVRLASELHAS